MAPGAKASAPEIAAGVATPTLHRVANDPAAETLPPYSPRAGTPPARQHHLPFSETSLLDIVERARRVFEGNLSATKSDRAQ